MNILVEKLWPELKVYKGRLVYVLLLGIFVSAFKGAIPELINRLIKSWENQDQQLAYMIPAAISIVWILSGVFRFFHLYWMKYISDLVAVKLKKDLIDKYLSLNLGFLDNFSHGSGGLISRLINDIKIIREGINKVSDLLREPFMTVFMLGYLLYLDWTLALFILSMTPIVAIILKQIARSLRKYGHQNQESFEGLTKILKESLDGSRVIQSFNLQNILKEKFNSQANVYLKTRKKIIGYEEGAGPITESVSSIFIALLLTYISFLVFKEKFSISEFTSFMFAMGLLLDSGKKIQNGYVKIQQASVATTRIHEILSMENPISEPQDPLNFPKDWSQINFNNIDFHFNQEDPLLKGINLIVKKGETIAIVGASGSGKSTLMNLLTRFYDPVRGDVCIDDLNIKQLSLKGLRDNIALVTQDVFLFSDSIENNIRLGNLQQSSLDTKPDAIHEVSKMANAHEFIDSFPEKYQTQVGDRGSLLSGGEKQRVSIARAIYKNAPILILDEATSALDSVSEKDVQMGLKHLMEGRTTFIIAHRLSTIMNANRILVFKNGVIVEEGTHENLLQKKGEYHNYYEIQKG